MFVDLADNFRIGEDHLTGGSSEDSTPLVVDRPVDEYPKHDRLLFFARRLQTVEQASLPCDLSPLDTLDFHRGNFGANFFN